MISAREDESLYRFAKYLSGKFSNKEQAYKFPRDFAHINIYFYPLPSKLFKDYSFYSEQSYHYNPWSPYRQAVIRLKRKDERLILKNYKILTPERFAGGGFDHSLIKEISRDRLIKREGCEMEFREICKGHYSGNTMPGKKCIISRNRRITYLVSHVDIYKDKLISLDQGYDIQTNKKIWGSDNGEIRCVRTKYYQVNK